MVRRCVALRDGRSYAVKRIREEQWKKNPWAPACIRGEVHALARLSHPHIISLKELFEDRGEITIVTELMPGGDLLDYITKTKAPLSEPVLREVVRQVGQALLYLHTRKYIHGDLKPDNIFILDSAALTNPLSSSFVVKVGDLGQVYRIPDSASKRLADTGSRFTTLEYAAPETFSHCPRDYPADMWSLGVSMYVLLTGMTPFPSRFGQQELIKAVTAGDWSFPANFDRASRDLVEVIEGLLEINPQKRMTISQLTNHRWFM